MRAYILCMKMEGQEPYNLGVERKNLADYVRSNCALTEHLCIVTKFLKNEYDFVAMLDHAKNLHKIRALGKQNIDVTPIISQFNDRELKVVSEYMHAVGDYSCGQGDFESVDTLADQLISLIPIPDTIYAPPGSFPEDLARAREEV